MFFAIFQQIGMPELIVISFIILLLFGAKRLPELFRSMGKSIGEFKKATREIEDEVRSAMDEGDSYNNASDKPKPKPKAVESSNSSSAAPAEETEKPKEVTNN